MNKLSLVQLILLFLISSTFPIYPETNISQTNINQGSEWSDTANNDSGRRQSRYGIVDLGDEPLNDFQWDYIEEEIPWSLWVDRLLSFEENEEALEEITPLLLRLERWYHLPRNLNTLTSEDLETFFWLSSGEKKSILDYRVKQPFTNIEELYQKKIISPESYGLIQPFITIKKQSLASLKSQPRTEISYGIALRAKELESFQDFSQVLKNYQFKIFGEVQVPGLLSFHLLGERDPNEIEILDLEKWSLNINWPIIPQKSPGSENDSLSPSSSSLGRFNLTLGALKINIHQSLLMATGYPLRKNEKASHTVKKNSSRIQSDKSSQEIFLQGQALDVHYDTWRLAAWSGSFRYDDAIETNTTDTNQLYADGYSFYATLHRPFPEFSLTENLFGFLIEKKINYHTLSIAFLYSRFTYPIITDNTEAFTGKSHWGMSWGWDLDFNRYRWYGETVLLFNENQGDPWGNPTYSTSGSLVTGARIFFPKSDFFFSFRYIPQSYKAVHNLAYTRYSSGNNEFGVLGGFRLRPQPRLNWVTSFDLFKKLNQDSQDFGIDISELVSYHHLSGYYNESQIRLRERGVWDDDYNHYWEIKHRSGWKKSGWHLYGETKLSGNLIEELIDSPNRFGLLLTLHGEYRYRQISTTVLETLWTQEGPRTLYDVLYHNRFFNDLLYLNQDAFLVFIRQELRHHTLLNTGFSVGFYWDNSEEKLFHSANPNRVMFSFYVSGAM